MKTNKEFQELTEAEKSAYFESLTADEVDTLTKLQSDEYNEWLQAQANAPGESKSDEPKDLVAAGKDYFKANKNYPYDSVVVVSDGSFFAPTAKGENALMNHLSANSAKNLSTETVNRHQ